MLSEIIKGCRKWRRESQKELYQKFYAYGMSITLRYSDSREEASAILNDAFMKVFNNIDSYDSERPFKPWLRRIIVNTAIDHFRKNKATGIWEELDEEGEMAAAREEIISTINYDQIIEMVQELSPAYRTVFNLYVIEGFKHREISGMLGISEGTSKSNLAKAKSNLRVILEKRLV